jgi:hypothetical protein
VARRGRTAAWLCHAFGVFGSALKEKTGVFHPSSLKMIPKTPDASYAVGAQALGSAAAHALECPPPLPPSSDSMVRASAWRRMAGEMITSLLPWDDHAIAAMRFWANPINVILWRLCEPCPLRPRGEPSPHL